MSNQRASCCSWYSLLFVPFSHPTVRSPAGKPSQISSQSYRQTAPGGGDVSGSMLKLSNSTTISDILGAKIMKVQSRLLGYFSGKPGVSMVPLGAVKFLEHSGPARTEDSWVFGQTDLFWRRQRCEHCRGQRSGQILLSFHIKVQQDRTLSRGLETKKRVQEWVERLWGRLCVWTPTRWGFSCCQARCDRSEHTSEHKSNGNAHQHRAERTPRCWHRWRH